MARGSGKLIKQNPLIETVSGNGLFYLDEVAQYQQASKWPSVYSMVTNGLTFYLNSANASSYSGSGSTWSDLSGNAYNASLVSTGYTTDATAGGVITFNGSPGGSRMTTPIGPMSYSSPTFTYDIWFKCTGSQTGQNGCTTCWGFRFNSGGNVGNFEQVIYCTDYNGTVLPHGGFVGRYGGGGTGSSTFNWHPSQLVFLNTWVNFAVSHTAGSSKFYINGNLIATGNYNYTTYTTATNLWFGNGSAGVYGGHFGPGYVSQIRYYNRILTDQEVYANFGATRASFGV